MNGQFFMVSPVISSTLKTRNLLILAVNRLSRYSYLGCPRTINIFNPAAIIFPSIFSSLRKKLKLEGSRKRMLLTKWRCHWRNRGYRLGIRGNGFC